MPNLMQRGATWLAGKLQTAAGRTVVYSRGQHKVTLTAWPSSAASEEIGVAGVVLQRDDALNFGVLASELVLHSERVEPKRGDRIEITQDTGTEVYEVMADDTTPPYTWSDDNHTLLTIHARRVKRFA